LTAFHVNENRNFAEGIFSMSLSLTLMPMPEQSTLTLMPEQCRAARAWLDWSQDDLAAAARVSQSTVRDFEKGRRIPIANNLEAMRAALEARGIGFAFAIEDGQPYACGVTFSISRMVI
jgi:DNA-binding transcriptional regulator YiaG